MQAALRVLVEPLLVRLEIGDQLLPMALPRGVIDIAAALSIAAMVALLVHRYIDPVKRLLSDYQDYLTWLLSFLPLLTGYLAYHRLVNPYPLILGLHILTVNLLLVVFPFTKLTHVFTTFIARWYNGAIFGRKGVQS